MLGLVFLNLICERILDNAMFSLYPMHLKFCLSCRLVLKDWVALLIYIAQHEYLNIFISPCAKLGLEANKENNLFEFHYVRSSTKLTSFSLFSFKSFSTSNLKYPWLDITYRAQALKSEINICKSTSNSCNLGAFG